MTRDRLLDGWRGFAVLGVLFGHFVSQGGPNFGRFGVEMFFVLSGRLMAEILFVQASDLGNFYVRRFARVFPALAVYAFAAVPIAAATPFAVSWADLATALTFTHNYAQFWSVGTPFYDHFWSLCIEEHMYLLLGVIAWVHRRWGAPVLPVCLTLLVLALADGTLSTLAGQTYTEAYWRTDVHGASILFGVCAYLLERNGWFDRLASPLVPLALGIIALASNLTAVPDPIKYSVGTASLALMLVLMPRASGWLRRIVASTPALGLGMISFSVYLWQQPFFILWHGIAAHLTVLPLALVAAFISYRLVEQPARRAINRILHARRSRVDAPPVVAEPNPAPDPA